ncbi:unnamed protein product [Cunninghamella blakesleeana]
MLPPSIHKHKAVWASSIAIITLGAVVYFTVYRNSQEPSKPSSKKPIRDREVIQKEKQVIKEENDESIKSREISNQVDVSQVKATVKLEQEQEKTENQQIISDDVKLNTETEKELVKDHDEVKKEDNNDVKKEKEIESTTTTATVTTTIATTAQKDDINKNEQIDSLLTESIVQVNHDDQLNESFVLVNDTKTESTTDISSHPIETSMTSQPDQLSKTIVQEKVEGDKKKEVNNNLHSTTATTPTNTTIAPTLRSTTNQQHSYSNNNNTMNLNNNTNGMYINGYWHAPTATTTFQHSMGWPELFPLQQQQQNQQDFQNNNKKQQPLIDESDPAALKKYQQKEKKRNNKKKMTRLEQIDQQRQNYVPTMKSRCNWWPNCTNKNCKYFHPHQPCRYGDLCIYNERCMFLHPWDYEESFK